MDTTEYPTFPAVLDACVLYPLPLRDTLLRAAEIGLYRPHWSDRILEEVTRNLIDRGKINIAQAERFQAVLQKAFPQASVEVLQALVDVMTNDPKDRHVLAAAVGVRAQVVVTFNLKDFQDRDLEPWDVQAQHPDVFLSHLYHIDQEAMVRVVLQQAQALKRPPMKLEELLVLLEAQVPKFVELLRQNLLNSV
jgi:predicted nucleic acid-binding protein